MSAIGQALAVTALNLRSLRSRFAPSLVVIVGIATVVAVFVSVLAMSMGYIDSMKRTGRPDRAIVLDSAAETESSSSFSRDNVLAILGPAGIRKAADGEPVVSAETLDSFAIPGGAGEPDAFFQVRGVGRAAVALRPEVQLVAGRLFRPGLHELIAGRAALKALDGIQVGSTVPMPDGDWTVTGIFASNGDAHESEFMTDVDTVNAALRRADHFSSVTVWLEDGALAPYTEAVSSNPRVQAVVKSEPAYYEQASRGIRKVLYGIACVIGGFMALGAVFGALNTMYSAVSTRGVELATLRAIGFGNFAVVSSVLAEALLLAGLGAVLGVLAAWLFFDHHLVSLMAATGRGQLTFALRVTPGLAAAGAGCALAIGALGGIFPAIRAARRPVAVALRG
jgi:putative ABC transport system permease protein